MASLKDIKRKVGAVQKTKQITRAMNMVAASKFKASQLRMENFRPYASKFMDVLNSLWPCVWKACPIRFWLCAIPGESE